MPKMSDVMPGEITVPMAPGDVCIHMVKQTGEVVVFSCGDAGESTKGPEPMDGKVVEGSMRGMMGSMG